MIHDHKDPGAPIVIVANKCDLEWDPAIPRESLEAVIFMDWENAYVEASAKDKTNVYAIFKELLRLARGESRRVHLQLKMREMDSKLKNY